jgi:hypothetical protein
METLAMTIEVGDLRPGEKALECKRKVFACMIDGEDEEQGVMMVMVMLFGDISCLWCCCKSVMVTGRHVSREYD